MKQKVFTCLKLSLTALLVLGSSALGQTPPMTGLPQQMPQGAIISLLEAEAGAKSESSKLRYAVVFASAKLDGLLLSKLLELKARGLTLQIVCDGVSCQGRTLQTLKTQVSIFKLPGTIGQNVLLTDTFAATGGLDGATLSTVMRDPSMLAFLRTALLEPLKKAPRLQ